MKVGLAEFPWVLLGALALKWDRQKFQSAAHFVSCGPNFGLGANFANFVDLVLAVDVAESQDASIGGYGVRACDNSNTICALAAAVVAKSVA